VKTDEVAGSLTVLSSVINYFPLYDKDAPRSVSKTSVRDRSGFDRIIVVSVDLRRLLNGALETPINAVYSACNWMQINRRSLNVYF